MFDPAVWREHNGERRQFGLVVTRNGLTIHYGKSLLRIRWTGQWSK